MDTALPQKFPFILDRNLAKANCTGNHVCTSCDKVVLGQNPKFFQENSNARILIKLQRFMYQWIRLNKL